MTTKVKGNSTGQWLPLVGLACSAFVFNTSEFMPIGLLSDIASDLRISDAQAGMLISVYAWVVAFMSLPLMIMASRMELKRLMLGIVALFVVSHIGSALATGYYTLMLSRMGVACAHAIFWSIVSPMAVRTVPPERRAMALGVVATGSSVAMVVGLPLGRIIGIYVGWRATFLSIGIITAVLFAYLAAVLPRLESRGGFSPRRVPQLLRNRVLTGIFIMSVLFATAHYTGYSYIEPFLGRIAGMTPDTVTLTLIVFGALGLLGSIAFSKCYMLDRYRFIAVVTAGPAVSMLLMQGAAGSFWAIMAVCVVWGSMATAFNVAFQDSTMRYAPVEATSVAMSIFSGIFNLGIGLGACIGANVVTRLSLGGVGYVGGAIGLAATAYCLWCLFPQMRRSDTDGVQM